MAQTTVWGIENIGEIQPIKDRKKILLVADSSFPYLSIRNEIEQSLGQYVKFSDFKANPLYEDVCKGVETFLQEGCEAIVAVGGGSCIDVAKCIKLFCRIPSKAQWLQGPWEDSGVPLTAIPTTAGTGSEATRYAVIYANGVKQSITHTSIIPNYVLLEPKVLITLPLYQKKCTYLDALCQGIESWWSVNSTDLSMQHSAYAVANLIDNMEAYLVDNKHETAQKIMDAANRAGQAINITQTTAPHAFSYKLTSLYQLPHGHAVAICLPHIWKYMIEHPEKCIDPRGKKHLENTFIHIAEAMHCSSPSEAIQRFHNILERLEITNPTAKNRFLELDILQHSVNPVRLKNNPVELDLTAILNIYNTIVQ